MTTYLENLTIRLATAMAELPDETRHRHAAYLKTAQRADGGFAGREGESDLYYTGFALRGLAVLGELHGVPAQRAAEFLRGRLTGRESIIDFLSLIYGATLLSISAGIDVFGEANADWREATAATMERLRRDDGGYAKSEEGFASSTYHTFLVLLCLELIERPVVDPRRIVDFILSQRADEGGFREIRASKRAGVNPTAAAIGALRIVDGLNDEIREATIDFLVDMQSDDGGLLANTRIPLADVLSTFTGAITLADLDALDQIDVTAARRFAQSLERPEGGFHAVTLDTASDVEYTFYGLGCLAMLAEKAT